MIYSDYLKDKKHIVEPVGFHVEIDQLNSNLKPFQAAIVKWALARGRSANFCDTGLGKTFQQLEWAHHVHRKTDMPVLIFAPLAVAPQTISEADKFGIKTKCVIVSEQSEVINGINVANYEKMHHFDSSKFGGLVLDESSILKGFNSKTRMALNDFAKPIKYRLACSATPAPNDHQELANHAEFLDAMTGKAVMAMYFIQDGNTTHKWRLKKHAVKPFWEFISSWAIAVRKPSDIGFEDDGYILPDPVYHEHVVSSQVKEGLLFAMDAQTMTERRQARKESISDRCDKVSDIVGMEPDEQWLVWCDLNDESNKLKSLIPDASDVKGSDKTEYKEKCLIGFKTGDPKHLVSKPSICGFGMNYQHCARMAFVGLSDSFEQMYQARRRILRFGQKRQVHIHVITAESEGAVVANIKRKERDADEMYRQIIQNMSEHELYKQAKETTVEYQEDKIEGQNFTAYLGDSCERLKEIESDSIGLSVFSPPFPGMYAYLSSNRDIGNNMNSYDLLSHLDHLTPELYRVLMPGRNVAIHITQEVLFKKDVGYSGLFDFRSAYIAHMVRHGFQFKSERFIDKDPQLKSMRTRDVGLAMKTAASDSAKLTGTMPDILLQFTKPGENTVPIRALKNHPTDPSLDNPDGWMTTDEWIEWASGVWYGYHRINKGGIRETDVLQVRSAKDDKDEKHLCPLQIGVIERCVKLWSAPDDIVLSPFMGIGSEGATALKHDRKFIGIELKPSYFKVAVQNLKNVKGTNMELFK
jgi:DNA modification methylase